MKTTIFSKLGALLLGVTLLSCAAFRMSATHKVETFVVVFENNSNFDGSAYFIAGSATGPKRLVGHAVAHGGVDRRELRLPGVADYYFLIRFVGTPREDLVEYRSSIAPDDCIVLSAGLHTQFSYVVPC